MQFLSTFFYFIRFYSNFRGNQTKTQTHALESCFKPNTAVQNYNYTKCFYSYIGSIHHGIHEPVEPFFQRVLCLQTSQYDQQNNHH